MTRQWSVLSCSVLLVGLLQGDISLHAQSSSLTPVTAGDRAGWQLQNTGIPASFYAVSTVSGNVCWMAGSAGHMIRTTDGGGTWTSIGSGIIGAADIYVFEALNEGTAFASTTPGTTTFLYRTTNAGTSWSQVYSQSGGFINGIKMYNQTRGIAIGDPVGGRWTILRTLNGGATWARDTLHEPLQIGGEAGWNGSFGTFDTSNIWFGTNSNRSYVSTDGGQTWHGGQCLGASLMWFNSATLGLAVCGNSVYRSTDGGSTWTPASTPLPVSSTKTGLTGALGTTEFWLILPSYGIFYSPDAGNTWTISPPHGYGGRAYFISMVTLDPDVFAWATRPVALEDTVLHYERVATRVDEERNELPGPFSLAQNYPNPFNPTTTIRYQLPAVSFVSLKVFDILGREVASLVNEKKERGNYSVMWDASCVASGVYLYQLNAGPYRAVRKLVSFK